MLNNCNWHLAAVHSAIMPAEKLLLVENNLVSLPDVG
jgi:hypothetical protein